MFAMSILARVAIPADSGLPEDVISNSWCIDGPTTGLGATELGNLATAVINFYNAVPAAQPDNVSGYFSPRLSRVANACDVNLYTIDETPPVVLGAPIHSVAWTLGAVGSSLFTPLPDELACCLSLAADYNGQPESIPAGPSGPEGDLRPRARRRGRVYLGPLNSQALSTAPTEQSRPSTEFTSVVLAAVGVLRDAITAASPVLELGIWSRTDNITRKATSAWIDNAWDIQRRRGRRPTTRTTVLL